MKIRWFQTVSMAGLLAAVAVGAHAQGDDTLNAAGVNPLYPAVSTKPASEGGIAPTEGDHALHAADTNPFYLGMGRAESVSFSGGAAPTLSAATLNATDVNPLY